MVTLCNNTLFEFTSGKATQPKRFWWAFLTSRHSPRQLILILLWARLYLKRDFLRVLLILRDSLKFAQVISNAAKEVVLEEAGKGPLLTLMSAVVPCRHFVLNMILYAGILCLAENILCSLYYFFSSLKTLCARVTNGYLHWCGFDWVGIMGMRLESRRQSRSQFCANFTFFLQMIWMIRIGRSLAKRTV